MPNYDPPTIAGPYAVPLGTTIGGSQIGDPKKPGSRVTGPPSQKFPILRDLAEANAKVTIEIDTEDKRIVGTIKSLADRMGGQILYLAFDPSQLGRGYQSVALKAILAFRVLKVEVDELPANL